MAELGASDLHLSCGEKPIVRVDGSLRRLDDQPPLTEERLVELLRPVTPEDSWAEFERCADTDFAYEVAGLARFRGNLFRDRKGLGAVFRIIPSKILTAEQLGLSDKVLELCQLTKGLVLVTGPTGSGKSTTLTAMIDWINKNRDEHVITIEDPIEFVHENIRCLINQREVGRHTEGFKRALRAALREDPDIVLVGEMRDLETIAIAIETAETGHLVFGTLHTTTAVSTVDRIIDQFPEGQQAQVRTMLSESLKGVIAQTLCKKIGGGRVAALEVLIGIPSVSNLIREGKTFQIPSIMQTGRKYGMVTLNEALMQLVRQKVVEPEEAWRKCVDKIGMVNMMRGAGIDVSFVPGDREAVAVG
ncbi:MAG: type IV pilus twitching motility protein PilT [Acidobacteria bacterium]|nr:MAG: type IV pilus twitching motility protein PilT [Acidobacteriota bacterium]